MSLPDGPAPDRRGMKSAHRLALGTVQFGMAYGIANRTGQVSRGRAGEMLAVARRAGVSLLDTAIAYGESEQCLGEIGTDGFELVSKLPPMPADCGDVAQWVNGQLDASLARLGRNRLYGLLLHQPLQLLGDQGAALYRALLAQRDAGRVQKIGVSVYSPADLYALVPGRDFDLVQAPLNLIDQRLHRSGWLARLTDAGIEVHTRSAFLQGLLLMPLPAQQARFARWGHLWQPWHRWLEAQPSSPADQANEAGAAGAAALAACLDYPLSLPEVSRVVVGADLPEQLLQVIAAAAQPAVPGRPELACDDEDLVNPSRWSRP